MDTIVRESPQPIYEVRLPRLRSIPRMTERDKSLDYPIESDKSSKGNRCARRFLSTEEIFEEALIETMVTANGQRLRCKVPPPETQADISDKGVKKLDPSAEAEKLLARYTNYCFVLVRTFDLE